MSRNELMSEIWPVVRLTARESEVRLRLETPTIPIAGCTAEAGSGKICLPDGRAQ